MTALKKWAKENDVAVNFAKSGIIAVRLDKRTKPPIERSILGYPIVDNYKYLGVQVDSCLTLNIEASDKLTKWKSLAKLSGKLQHHALPPKLKFTLT